MKHKQQTSLSQTLPIKILFLSYLTHNEIGSLMSDCHNAIDQRISKLSSSIESNYNEISQIVDDDPQISNKQKSLKSSNELMQVIEQQEYGTTQRDNDLFQNQKSVQNKTIQKLQRKFNQSIKMLQKSSTKYEQIIYMYKKQLTDIAKQLTKQKQINKKITKELNQKYKDSQYRAVSANKLLSGKSSINTTINKSSYSFNQVKTKLTKHQQEHQSEDQEIRQPPKPFCEQCQIRQRQTQKRDKQALQQKNKWKALSIQITNLKDQLSQYQQQLINKQSQISKITEELKRFKEDQNKTQNQQKKKLRVMNTTLRGEKIVLENQILILKRKQQEFQDVFSVTQSQNKKLKMDNQNLASTIKWHQNTIQDLRKNYTVGVKQQGQIIKKYRQMQQQNQLLCRQIEDQEKYLQQFVKKLQEIQLSHEDSVKKLEEKIVELQNIIQHKNQTIVKLKIENRKQENNPITANQIFSQSKAESFVPNKSLTRQSGILKSRQDATYGMIMNKTLRKENMSQNQGFQQNMIKLLNKKIVDKQQMIEKLLKENEDLKQLVELSKDK